MPSNLVPLIPHPVIQSTLNRRVHCASSPVSAVRQVVKILWPTQRKFHSLPRIQRRFAIASILLGHARNQVEYRNVMGGTNRKWKKVKNIYWFNEETKETVIKK